MTRIKICGITSPQLACVAVEAGADVIGVVVGVPHSPRSITMETAGATILEPIMNVDIRAPEQYMGDVLGDLNGRRGKVKQMETRGTTQLIRASDGFHVWSENYDRDPADVIEIQEDLARSIAIALETTMDPEALAGMAAAGTRSVEAYLEYIEGRSVRLQEGRASPRRAYEHFERARAIDPGFARAHVEAADFWALQLNGPKGRSGPEDPGRHPVVHGVPGRAPR